MTRAGRRVAPLALGLFLFAFAAEAGETTVYVQRVVVADPGDVSLGDLVQARGDIGPRGQEALAQSVVVLSDAVSYVPVALYLDRLETAFGTDAIVVGSRSLVIPRGAVPEGEGYLLDRLADYLSAQGVLGDRAAELRFTQNVVTGTPPRQGNPVFTLRRSFSGAVEVSFSLNGDPGNSVTGRIVTSAPEGGGGSPPGVTTGSPVQVVFHRGLVTIEMTGKSLGSAGAGERVSVSVPDSRRIFSGTVQDGKVVSVELQ